MRSWVSKELMTFIVFLTLLLAVLPLTILYREKITDLGKSLLERYNAKVAYFILLLLTAVSSTIIPLPVWAYVGAAILIGLDVYVVSIISGLGTTLGSCTTYALGRYCSHNKWVRKRLCSDEKKISKAKSKLTKYGSPILFCAAFTPIPADPYYFVCGLLEFPFAIYAPIVLAARTLRYLIISVSISGAI